MKKRNIVFIARVLFVLLFVLFFGEVNSNLFASGSIETPLIRTKTDVDFIQEDPVLGELVFNRSKTKRSLAYLRAVAEAKNALIRQDYFSAVKSYSDLIVVYGEDVELLYGLAETYFALGYQETSFSYYDKIVKSSSQNQPLSVSCNNSNISSNVVNSYPRCVVCKYFVKVSTAIDNTEIRYSTAFSFLL
jgi:tetratricopeptide (TPR) repeat protein